MFKPELGATINRISHDFGPNLERLTIVAQNARFDVTVLQEKFGIVPPYVIDVKDLASHYDARMSHKLKDLAKLFWLKKKGETSDFKGLHYKDFTKQKLKELELYGNTDIEIETELFKILLPKLTCPEIEIPIARHTLGLYLNPALKVDIFKAIDLENRMGAALSELIDKTGLTKKHLGSNKRFPKTLTEALPGDESCPMKSGKKGLIPALAKDDEDFQLLVSYSDEVVANLCRARSAVKSWPIHRKKINKLISQARAAGGFLRVPLTYYAASTARFGGSGGVNLQNLGGRGRAGAGNHPLIQEMRSVIVAPAGHTLAIVDSAQIEARVLAWLAGQQDLLEGFANNEDIYSVFATDLFGSYVAKPSGNEPPAVGKLLKIRRGFGKDSILGCGYGMGSTTFYLNCISNTGLRSLFEKPVTLNRKLLQKIMFKHAKSLLAQGLENYVATRRGKYDEKFIAYLILTYRSKYSRIPKFWRNVESAFRWVIKYPHEGMTASSLRFRNDCGTVLIQLPSGRELRYRHARINSDKNIQWLHGYLWGGGITENLCQAIARDLLVYWILEVEKCGVEICLHVHDEYISVVREDMGRIVLAQMLAIMRTKPKWAEGLPLDAEGTLSKEYTK